MSKVEFPINKTNGSDVDSDGESRVSTNTSETNRTNGSKTKPRKKARGKKGNSISKPKSLYNLNCFIVEENAKQIFSVQFNHFVKDRHIFATASGYRVSIYECVEPKKQEEEEEQDDDDDFCGIKLLRAYDDPDRDEVFYTLAWSYDTRSSGPIIAAGGVRSVVRVIYCNGPGLYEKKFIGHTNAINEMKFHPTQPHLLLTSSKDHSMRLWNIESEICVAIFGGVSGHRDEVLTVDFDPAGRHIVSGGMDHSLKIWKIDEEIESAIESSATYSKVRKVQSFPTLHIHFADFTTRSIHRNYVDSVKFFGESFLSKSCENCVIWWKPGNLNEPGLNLRSTNSTPIHTFTVEESELWFVRMDVDPKQRYLAVGNQVGKIFVFDLEAQSPNITSSIMSHAKSIKPIRQIAFSRDGEILVAACDDGKVFRWDKCE